MAGAHVTYSLTETRQFRRLARFVDDVATLAGENADTELAGPARRAT